MKDYPLTHQQGYISIEQVMKPGMIKGDLGIQIAKDGRIWVCVNGKALIRFKSEFKQKEGKDHEKTESSNPKKSIR